MNLKPLFDKVVIEQHSAEEKLGGTNLYAPETSKEKPKRGTVVAVGEGLLMNDGTVKPIPLSVGDNVVFATYGGSEVEVDGKTYLVMAAAEVLAILE